MSRMQRRPVLGALVYIGVRYILWLVALNLVASVLVVKGVKPALAFYLLMLVPATVALFALLGTAEPDRFDAAPVAAGSGDEPNLRALTLVTMILLVATLLGLGLYAERYGSSAKDPNAPCVESEPGEVAWFWSIYDRC